MHIYIYDDFKTMEGVSISKISFSPPLVEKMTATKINSNLKNGYSK